MMIKKIFVILITAAILLICQGNPVHAQDQPDFDVIIVRGEVDVEIICGEQNGVFIVSSEEVLPIPTEEWSVEDGVLTVMPTALLFEDYKEAFYRITADNISRLEVLGSDKVTLEDVDNDSIEIVASGTANLSASGITENLKLNAAGNTNVKAVDLKSVNADVQTAGNANVEVFVTGELNASASGASAIHYYGNPQKTTSQTSDTGKIINHIEDYL